MIVYAVVFGHGPLAITERVLAIYDNEAAAKAHVDYEGETEDLQVLPWSVAHTFREPETEA